MNDDESRPYLSELDSPEADAPAAPTSGARYQRLGLIGAGGMGEVHAVHDALLGRDVAQKSARRDVPGAAAALVREAALTAVLEHPGIVPIYDRGAEPDGRVWYTMRLVRGQTLRSRLSADDPPLAHLRTLLAAVEAVAYAHQRGVVHCDLKCDNVMVGEHGEVQVADWGLATADGSARGGTPRFMSPEQRTGASATPAVDVWALGVMLFEVLAGPAGMTDLAATSANRPLAQRARDRLARRRVPPALLAVLDRCLQPDPADRYPDAAALAGELRRFLDGRLVDAHEYSARELFAAWYGRHRLVVQVAAVGLGLLLGVGALAWQSTRAERAAAVEARAMAEAAEARARARLADALVLAARDAARVDARPEAETLAAHALTLAESPAARGVLMAVAGSPAPRRAPASASGCGDRRADPFSRRWLCLDDGQVRLFDGDQPGWVVALAAEDAAFAGDLVVVTESERRLHVVDGEGRVQGVAAELIDNVTLASGRRYAWLYRAQHLQRIDPKARTVTQWAPCGERTLSSGAELAPDRVLIVCGTHTFVAVDAESGEANPWRPPPATDVGAFWALATHPGGAVAAASTQGTLALWPGRGAPVVEAPTRAITGLTWSHGGRRLAVHDKRGGAIIVDGATGVALGRLPARPEPPVASLGEAFAVGADEWDLGSVTPTVFRGPSGLAAVLPQPGHLVVLRGDGVVARYDRRDGRVVAADPLTPDRPLKAVVGLPDGRLAVLTAGAGLWIYAADLGERTRVSLTYGRRVAQIGGRLVISAYSEGGRVVQGDQIRVIGPESGIWVDLAAAPDRSWGASVSRDGRVWRIDADGGLTPAGAVAGAGALVALRDGTIVVAGRAGITELGPAGRRDFPRPGPAVLDLAVNPAEDLLALAGADESVRVFDRAGALRARLAGHEERVSAVVFDGDALLSASWDGAVRRWGLAPLRARPEALLSAAEARWGLTMDAALGARAFAGPLGSTPAPATRPRRPRAPAGR